MLQPFLIPFSLALAVFFGGLGLGYELHSGRAPRNSGDEARDTPSLHDLDV
jgi:hypothetical protein